MTTDLEESDVGRKRLMGLLAGIVLVLPTPATALEAVSLGDATDDARKLETVLEQDGESAGSEDSGVTVSLPGVGEVSVDGELDTDEPSLEVDVTGEVELADVGVSTSPDLSVRVSTDEAPVIEASAPTVAGPLEIDPVQEVVAVVDPVLDAVGDPVDDVAPGVLPDLGLTSRTDAPGAGGDDRVHSAGLPSGGHQARGSATPTVPVVRVAAPPARTAAPGRTTPTSVFAAPSEPAAVAAPAEVADPAVAAPALPDPTSLPGLLRILTAMLVAAAGVTNRLVARELR